jgi:hypothetical protein
MMLAYELFQRARPHPLGERREQVIFRNGRWRLILREKIFGRATRHSSHILEI